MPKMNIWGWIIYVAVFVGYAASKRGGQVGIGDGVFLSFVFIVFLFVFPTREQKEEEATKEATRKARAEELALIDSRNRERAKSDPQFRKELQAREKEDRDQLAHGLVKPKVICPHCQTTGQVRVADKTIRTKTHQTGVGRIIGQSTFSDQKVQRLRCGNCEMSWDV